jgi:hypothetical protein
VLEAYIDESDTKDDDCPILILAGYVAADDQWALLAKRWSEALSKAGVKYFHARKLSSGNSRLYRHLTFDRRRELITELSSAIADHVNFGIALMIQADSWELLTTKSFRCKYGSLYGAAISLLMVHLAAILKSPKSDPVPIGVFLEEGHANAMDALRRIRDYKNERRAPALQELDIPADTQVRFLNVENPFQDYRIAVNGYGLVEKRKVPPVQAADLLAYLLGALSRPALHPVYDGVLQRLNQRVKHHIIPVCGHEIMLIAERIDAFSEWTKEMNQGLWRRRKQLESLGVKVIDNKGQKVLDLRHLTAEQREKIIKIIGET